MASRLRESRAVKKKGCVKVYPTRMNKILQDEDMKGWKESFHGYIHVVVAIQVEGWGVESYLREC